MQIRALGWIPDTPDPRDYQVATPRRKPRLPKKFDLRPGSPPVYDQGELGSCTGNAVAGNCQWDAIQQKGEKLADRTPSRLLLYYNARWLEGTTAYDSGAMIRDVIKGIGMWGLVAEEYWPYDIARFAEHAPARVYDLAKQNLVREYGRVPQDLKSLQTTLKVHGPITFGATLFQSFMSDRVARTGKVPKPKRGEQPVGGHAMSLWGWDDAQAAFLVRNSWGAWGEGGYCWIPYEYVCNRNLCDDFWNVRFV